MLAGLRAKIAYSVKILIVWTPQMIVSGVCQVSFAQDAGTIDWHVRVSIL